MFHVTVLANIIDVPIFRIHTGFFDDVIIGIFTAGKYATKQLISNLPQENRPKDVTDETLCAVLACLNEVLSHNQDYARYNSYFMS